MTRMMLPAVPCPLRAREGSGHSMRSCLSPVSTRRIGDAKFLIAGG
jgi:hypothetical protein